MSARPGPLLDDALEAAGIERRLAYVTNAVTYFKWEALIANLRVAAPLLVGER